MPTSRIGGQVADSSQAQSDLSGKLRSEAEANEKVVLAAAVEEMSASVVANMEELGRNIGTIASAVEEQSATTHEISRAIGQAVAGNRGIQRNLQEGSEAIAGISRDIQSLVRQGNSLRDLAQASQSLVQSSQEVFLGLRQETERFRI